MKLELDFLRRALPHASVFVGNQKEVPIDSLKTLPVDERECVISIDSRAVGEGNGFLALCGNNVDGHDFLANAIESGASFVIAQKDKKDALKNIPQNVLIILVPDTLQALVDLAKEWRQRFSYPIIGVTGSVGKTTTKEMLRSIFTSSNISACVSYKNQNTLIGLSLNILRMRGDHKVAVFEVGISQTGEMEEKVDILRPTIGVITTVAHAHMGGLGELPEIAREKKKLFTFFKSDDIGVIYGDQPLLGDASFRHPVVRFGLRTKNHIQARKIVLHKHRDGSTHVSFTLKLYRKKKDVYLKTNHKGNVNNALAAVATSYLLGIDFSRIIKGLTAFNGFEERFETRTLKDNNGVLISDCYNANPESMRAAIMAVHDMHVEGEKIAVLGDMFELGEKELFWHRQIGRVLGKALSINHVILVGERAKSIGKTAPLPTVVEYANNWSEAIEKLKAKLGKPDSLVLVKGSHAMELHHLVDHMSE